MLKEDILFWLVNIYIFLEYVRPQTLYKPIDILPYTQIVIILATVLFFAKKNTLKVSNPANKILICLFFVILLSSIFAISPEVSFQKIDYFLIWVIIYFLIINIVNNEVRFFITFLAFLLYHFKLAQTAFRKWIFSGFAFKEEGIGIGPGWFHNSGEFGIAMVIFLPLAIYFIIALKDNWTTFKKMFFLMFPLTAFSGIISCSSRGAILGGAGVVFWMLAKSRKKLISLMAVGLIVIIFFILLPEEQYFRFQTAGQDKTSLQRLDRWKKGIEMVKKFPVLGVGYENWSVADKKYFAGEGRASHNIFIECMSELGLSGLLLFNLMIVYTFVNNYKSRRIAKSDFINNKFVYYIAHGLDSALIGYLISGFFVTVFYYPFFWINLAMTVALNNIAKKRNDALREVSR